MSLLLVVANPEMASRVRRKVEVVSVMLETINSVLQILEQLEMPDTGSIVGSVTTPPQVATTGEE